MRIGFMGSPDFSVATLSRIIDAGHTVPVVYSQPPRAKGRGKKVSPCPVHSYAETQGIEVLNPVNFKDQADIEQLKSFDLDLLVVVAYGIVLPQSVLDIPKLGCINGHASLLPRWRGASPIQRAIQAGDIQTGVCVMQMDAGLDTGDVISTHKVEISNDMNAGQLHDILADLTASAIVADLPNLETAVRTPQQEDGVCYAEKLKKQESVIDWKLSSTEIYNQIRAFNPFPSSQTVINETIVKIISGAKSEINTNNAVVGTVVSINPLIVACGEGAFEIHTLQKQGKNAISTKEFLNGNKISIGDLLG